MLSQSCIHLITQLLHLFAAQETFLLLAKLKIVDNNFRKHDSFYSGFFNK